MLKEPRKAVDLQSSPVLNSEKLPSRWPSAYITHRSPGTSHKILIRLVGINPFESRNTAARQAFQSNRTVGPVPA
jgi:hypothetical protein